MSRGRKAKPTPLKLLGGAQPCRVNHAEPDPGRGEPAAPAHLDDVALGEWRRMVEVLGGMRILTPADGAALAIYCAAYSRWLTAREEIDARGLILETALGGLKTNPAAAIAAAAEATMLKVLASFGLTPSDRGKVKAADDQAGDDLGAFLAGGA